MRELLTASRLSAARSCQRLHKIKYKDGYRPVRDSDALHLGSLVHRGLEAWWLAMDNRLDAAVAVIVNSECNDEFERVKALTMLTGYDARWHDEPYEALAVEQEFRTDLINPVTGRASQTWDLGGKIDVVVRDKRDGRVLIVEHKTSSQDVSPGSEYWRRLRMDGQVSIYFAGAKALGYDVQGCLYDVLLKPALRPYQVTSKRTVPETPEQYQDRLLAAIGEEPNKYYARGEVTRLESELDDAMLDIWELAKSLREAELAGRAPRNPDQCLSWGKMCSFFDVCCGAASLDDETMFIQNDNVHPELTLANGQPEQLTIMASVERGDTYATASRTT